MPSATVKLRLVCISDTHNQTPSLPPGDILIHAGDLTNRGTPHELERQLAWLAAQTNYQARIVVAGNHDLSLDDSFPGGTDEEASDIRALFRKTQGITYLNHEATTVPITTQAGQTLQVKIFGSPFSRSNGRWAFGYTETEAKTLWGAVPDDIDILITHGPALGLCDVARNGVTADGCATLLSALERVKPKVHVCGHRHEGRGGRWLWWNKQRRYVERDLAWSDPGAGSRKLSVMDVTGRRQGLASWSLRDADDVNGRLEASILGGSESNGGDESELSTSHEANSDEVQSTCVVNAAIIAKSYTAGVPKLFNKAIILDVNFPIRQFGEIRTSA